METQKRPYNFLPQPDNSAVLKLTGRILTQLKELEAKFEIQQELLFELRKNQINQSAPKTFEPIRGIHGLAEFLGVSPVTAQKLKNNGIIPFAQYDRVVLFDPQKVLEAMETNNKPKKKRQ